MQGLPKDVLLLLFYEYFDPLSTVRCSRLCKRFYRVLKTRPELLERYPPLALRYRLRLESEVARECHEKLNILRKIINHRIPDGVPLTSEWFLLKCKHCKFVFVNLNGLRHVHCPMQVETCHDCGKRLLRAQRLYQHVYTCPKRRTWDIKARYAVIWTLVAPIRLVEFILSMRYWRFVVVFFIISLIRLL